MDSIIIRDARFLCNVGVSAEERKKKQKILIDMELFLNLKKAAENDELKHTVNYSGVCSIVAKLIEKKEYKLIEAIAWDIAGVVLKEFNIKKAIVEVKKPGALHGMARYAAARIERFK